MNGVVLQDSGRPGKIGWATATIGRGHADGLVVSPFESPRVAEPRRPSASQVVAAVTDAGGTALFDPMTHAALLASTNHWDNYDTWDLWAGARRDLSSHTLIEEHVRRALDAQVHLGLAPVAPTVRLESSVGPAAQLSLELAATATSQANRSWLAIVGTAAFWAQGTLLDDYIGQIAQLRPLGVLISVARTALAYPPDVDGAEISGMCRSVHSLSLRCEVVVQHADLFGLPALAAGAHAIGAGWDLRQRVLAPQAFRTDTQMRRTANRITHSGLLGVLKRPEAERLLRLEPAMSRRLVPGALPGNGNPLWEHHLSVLADVVARTLAPPDRESRARGLAASYTASMADFRSVEGRARPIQSGPAAWLGGVTAGLSAYVAGEGW